MTDYDTSPSDGPQVAVLGAGAHGREVAAVLKASGDVVHVLMFDDDPAQRPGPGTAFAATLHTWTLGAAWPQVRADMVQAILAQPARVMPPYKGGLVIFPGAHVGTDTSIGPYSHIGYGAVVSHGCRLEPFAHVCPGAILGGDARIGEGAFVGAGAVVSHGRIHVGAGALVGAGAVVINDVPPGVVVAGNPARVIAESWDYRAMADGRRGRRLTSSGEFLRHHPKETA